MFISRNSKLSWSTFERNLSRAVARFPVVVIALFVMFGVATIMLYVGDEFLSHYILVKLLFTSLFVIFCGYGMTLTIESSGSNSNQVIFSAYIVLFVTTLLYYLYLPANFQDVSFDIILLFVGIHILAIVSIFCTRFVESVVRGTYKDVSFYVSSIKQCSVFLESFFVSFLIFVLGAVTLSSIGALFSFYIPSELYTQWWLCSAILVGPFYALVHAPTVVKIEETTLGSLKTFLRFVVLYIAIPFTLIYFLILYVYSLQVLLNFSEWPKGIVSWLVIFFSFFGWLTFFLSWNFKKESIVSIFRMWFPYILVPQLGMLFYAIGLRVAQHGITINRYLVLAFGIWITFLCIYYIFSKKKRLFTIPASLFLIVLFVLIGPWNMFSISEKSQLERLEVLFIKYNLIVDGSIITADTETLATISESDQRSVTSVIRYLCENHGCSVMGDIFGNTYTLLSKENKNRYELTSSLIESTGIPEYRNTDRSFSGVEFLSVYQDRSNFSRDISSFDLFQYVELRQDVDREVSQRVSIVNKDGQTFITFDETHFDITNDLILLLETYGNRSLHTEQEQDLSFVLQQDGISLLFVPISLSGDKNKEGEIHRIFTSGYVFIDYK